MLRVTLGVKMALVYMIHMSLHEKSGHKDMVRRDEVYVEYEYNFQKEWLCRDDPQLS